MTANLTSLTSGLLVIFISILTITAYGWSWKPGKSARSWFAHGIFAGFFGLALNALYWSVLVRSAAIMESTQLLADLRYYGGYADAILKGLGCWAGYAHLRAVWIGTPEEERKDWSVLGIAFYPNRSLLVSRALNAYRRR
jgi:hypothetical protein